MKDPLFSVADQVVLVSGGSRGIGKAIARGFAERGARVTITGRDQSTLEGAADEIADAEGATRPAPRACDVAETEQIKDLVQDVLAQEGRIDTLINVAGVNRRKPALEVTEDDYDYVVDINLKGAFFLSQAVGRHMVERGSGSQINVGSLNIDRPLKNVLPYAASKSGLGQMTRALAMEWGPHRVRVNCLSPGFILTDLTQKLWSIPEMQAWAKENTPLERLGAPDDLIGAAIFLASPAAAFMTGQDLYVDGGVTAGLPWPIPADGGQ